MAKKPIEGYPNYEVHDDGQVWSKASNKFLKPRVLPKGYERVGLSNQGKVKDYYIHRLVATAYIENPDNLPEVNHIDANKNNNSVDNLEWVDSLANNHHAANAGLQYKGNSKCRAYSEEFVEITKRVIESKQYSQAEIANKLGISKATISGWATGRKRKNK